MSDLVLEGAREGSLCCREVFSPILQVVKPDSKRVIYTQLESCIRARIRIWVPASQKSKLVALWCRPGARSASQLALVKQVFLESSHTRLT